MAEVAVLTNGVECKRCANMMSNSDERKKLDQTDLSLLTESVQRIKLIGRTLWEFDDMDKVERGTVAVMLDREASHIFDVMCSLECRLGD